MAPTLGSRVFTNGLNVLNSEANRLDICQQQPTTFTEAWSTSSLGYATPASIAASPVAASAGGYEAIVQAISAGSVVTTGCARYWAITDTSNSRLLATGSLSASQQVTASNTFTLDSFAIRIPDPA